MPKYDVTISWSDEDGAFIAFAPDLPGCSAHGDTREEALANCERAMEHWLATARDFGRPVPPPGGFNRFVKP